MGEIVNIDKAVRLTQRLKGSHHSIVLVGGCFDILHAGHVQFLENAKKQGNYLLVLLESDQQVKKLKGPGRPINSQNLRAKVLSVLRMVDYVVILPEMKDSDYDKLVEKIKPNVIAATRGDPMVSHKKRAAKLVGADLKLVIKRISERSTTKLIEVIKNGPT